jgi:hypothetical protein
MVTYVNAQGMPTGEGRHRVVDSEFRAWLGEDGAQALVSRNHGRYYVHCIHFGIAGTGETQEAAADNVQALLSLYLQASYLSGKSFEESKKPVPAKIRLRLWMRHLRGGILKHIVLPLGRVGRRDLVPISRDTASFSA